MLNGRTSFVDSLFNLTVLDTSIDMEPFSLNFNGISDISDVATRLVNFMGNVGISRLTSLSKYKPAIYKFNHLFNQLVSIIPDEIDIPNTDLYVQGGISNELRFYQNQYVQVPMDIAILNRKYPMTRGNNANFGPF
jgi:hypothetical protein